MAISTVLKLFIPTPGTIEMGNIQTTAEITTPKRKAAAAAAAAVIPRWLGVCKKIIALCTSWKVSVRMHFVNIYTTVCILLQILLLVLMGVLLELLRTKYLKPVEKTWSTQAWHKAGVCYVCAVLNHRLVTSQRISHEGWSFNADRAHIIELWSLRL